MSEYLLFYILFQPLIRKNILGYNSLSCKIINANYLLKVDSSLSTWTQLHNWEEDEVRDLIRDCFVTGNWSEGQDAEKLLALDDEEEEDVFGDFEDLETGEKHESKAEKNESDGNICQAVACIEHTNI